ncbi:MAG: hypothetical protein ACLR52_07175 [Veillonella atypica]|nr:hypothetical protein BN182_350011 [Clostridioides difficile E9]CCL70892.1 hypothetical protein BN184_350013 [Clostridioides difficile T3]
MSTVGREPCKGEIPVSFAKAVRLLVKLHAVSVLCRSSITVIIFATK